MGMIVVQDKQGKQLLRHPSKAWK